MPLCLLLKVSFCVFEFVMLFGYFGMRHLLININGLYNRCFEFKCGVGIVRDCVMNAMSFTLISFAC